MIRDSVDQRGYPPSIREICEAAGLASTSSVAHQLAMLERKGFLRRDPNRPRAVDVRTGREVANAKAARRGARSAAAVAPSTGADAPVFVPVVGRIAAGGPILAEQMIEDVFPLPKSLVGEGTLFLLKVVGDSMIDAAISDGDWVVVRQQPDAANGEIVAAMIDGEATVKTFRRRDGHAWLLPHNAAYAPIPATMQPCSAGSSPCCARSDGGTGRERGYCADELSGWTGCAAAAAWARQRRGCGLGAAAGDRLRRQRAGAARPAGWAG